MYGNGQPWGVTLSDIAAGLEVTAEQRDRGVAAVDSTDADLASRLEAFAAELPCEPGTAATLVEAYAAGRSVGESARVAGLAPVTGAKALYLLGEPVSPLSATAREVVRDWLDARISRADAVELAGVGDREFALGAWLETHEPLPGAVGALEGALATAPNDPLADARSSTDEFL